jgi:aminocarboxymuconate-semialdehyde decarboxylase
MKETVIDLHTHVIPARWPDLEKKFGYGGWVKYQTCSGHKLDLLIDKKLFRTVDDRCWSVRARKRDCRSHGVDMQVLSTMPVMFAYWAKPEDALYVAKTLNDDIASIVQEDPTSFQGLGTVPLQDPELAIGELERCVNELGLRGIEIGTHVNDWNLDAPELFPVFEACQRLGVGVFVHPWEMMGKAEMPDYWLPWLVGMPAETARAACSLHFGGVLDRLEDLKIALAHGGGSFPFTIGRIQHGFEVRPDLCQVNTTSSPRTALDRFVFDSLVHDEAALKFLIDQVGAERIALGSDYPFPLGEAKPGELIRSLPDLSGVDRNRMLGGTAREFLGLDEDDAS